MSDAISEKFATLQTWRRGDARAPHKPLLVLLALGALQQGKTRLSFEACEPALAQLLREFGPPSRSVHPEYPFWRLQNDGLWVVNADAALQTRASNSDPPRTQLRELHATGSFTTDVQNALRSDAQLLSRIARRVLDAHFPDTLHEDILTAVGLDLSTDTEALPARRRRDPRFRQAVLVAYGYRCAMCGLDLRLGGMTIGVEAAHVKWHQAQGPDDIVNGVALCNLHHKLFDLGAFTLGPGLRLLVSEQAHGTTGFEEMLLRFHGHQLAAPTRAEHSPWPDYVDWHQRQVFKPAARPL